MVPFLVASKTKPKHKTTRTIRAPISSTGMGTLHVLVYIRWELMELMVLYASSSLSVGEDVAYS